MERRSFVPTALHRSHDPPRTARSRSRACSSRRADAAPRALADALAVVGASLPTAAIARAADRHTSAAAARLAGQLLALDATDVELTALRAERALDDALSGPLTLVPGTRDALAALGARVRLAAVTRLPPRTASHILARASLDDVVAVVIGDAEKDSPSWHEQALVHLARMHRPLERRRVIALEDSATAVDAARAAGVVALRVASVAALSYDALADLLTDSR